MQCKSCGSSLDPNVSGFIVCPHCHTVNNSSNPRQSLSHTLTASETDMFYADPNAPRPKSRQKHISKRLVIIGGFASFLILVSAAIGTLAYQNNKAASLLALAKTNVSQGHYDQAAKLLQKAGEYYSLPNTHSQIKKFSSQNTIWIQDNSEFQQAEALAQKGDYDGAKALIDKIDKSFPDYSKVVTLSDKIAQSQKQLADAAAAAKAAKTPAKSTTKTTSKSSTPTNTGQTAGKRFTSTAAMAVLAKATSVGEAQQALQTFVSQYNLTIQITSVQPTNYHGNSFNLLTNADMGSLKTYGALFIDEWAKYPTSWVTNSKVKSIALIKNFATDGTNRAAYPEVGNQTMYYDAGYSGDYAREVVHHEFDHLLTYNYFGSMSPSDPTWQSYNPPGFSYGNGGASCYQPGNTCLTGPHPIAGFASGYASSAIEEDKAELYAYLMTGTYYHMLVTWLPGDSYLSNKVNNYKQFISSHSPEMSGSYFNDIDP